MTDRGAQPGTEAEVAVYLWAASVHIGGEGDDCDGSEGDWCQSCLDDAVADLSPENTGYIARRIRSGDAVGPRLGADARQQGRETLDVERLARALRQAPTSHYFTNRAGRFNDAWWTRWAQEVADALAADPRPLHSDPEMQARCDGKCASDECVCPDLRGPS